MNRCLEIVYIVDHIFGFLNFDEIKVCRLVGRLWKNVATRVLRKKSCVKFHHYGVEHETKMEGIIEWCSKNEFNESPFTSFIFTGGIILADVVPSIEKLKNYTKELTINASHYSSYEANVGEKELFPFPINSIIGCELTKLQYEYEKINMSTTGYFSPIGCATIQNLQLNNCEIMVGDYEPLLCLKTLILGSETKFVEHGQTLKNFVVNKIFNLKAAEEIKLNGEHIVLDLSYSTHKGKSKCVSLTKVQVINWDKCDWKFKVLLLHQVPLMENTDIEIQELRVVNTRVDFSKILNPSKIRKLVCRWKTTVLNKPFFFPNVTELRLDDSTFSSLPYFTNCKNIINMHLSSSGYNNGVKVNVENLPNNLQLLELDHVLVEGNGVCHLETLYLHDYYCRDAYDADEDAFYLNFYEYSCIADRFSAKHIFIDQDGIMLLSFNDVVDFLKYSHPSFEFILLGAFYCYNKHDCPMFYNLVNTDAAKYYVFQKLSGLAVDANQFDKLKETFQRTYDFKPIENFIQNMMHNLPN